MSSEIGKRAEAQSPAIAPGMSFIVHPWLCDAMGHLSARYFAAFFDDAAYRLFVDVDGAPRSMQQRGFGWADAKLIIEYRREVLAGTVLGANSSVIRIGNKSIDHRHELIDLDDGELCATMHAVTVRMNLTERCSAPLSASIRARAARLLAGGAESDRR